MCDYSLMNVPNRLAREGEELVTHRFTTGSIGLASHLDLQANIDQPVPLKWTLWSSIRVFLNPPAVKPVPAICIPPGASLILRDISEQLQREANVGPAEEVTFTQVSEASHAYRDAVRFPNGRVILLQQLNEGQRVRVLALGPDAQVEDIVPEERLSRVLR
jgi:hypothetical protein